MACVTIDDRKIVIRNRRYLDEARTKRVLSKSGEKKESVKTFELNEEGDEMFCTESIFWEDRDEQSEGWSFTFRRVGGESNRK